MICLIYFIVAQFNDNIKFRWRILTINDLMLINLHISLITKPFFRPFVRQSDQSVTHSELLLDINNFSKTIVHVIRKSHEFRFKIVRVIMIVVSNPVNFLINARPMTFCFSFFVFGSFLNSCSCSTAKSRTPSQDTIFFTHLPVQSPDRS